MKRGTPGLAKTKRLARTLGVPLYAAVGLLELLWHVTVEQAPQGDIGRLTDEEIAEEVGWDGTPALLLAALLEHRWLDRDDTHRLVVHDWHDHADQTLRRKLERLGVEFVTQSPVASQQLATGYPPASQRLASREAPARLGSGSQGGERERGEIPGSSPGHVGAACEPVAPGTGSRVPQAPLFTPELEAVARAVGCRNPALVWQQCQDHFRSKGKRVRDWGATYRNWVRKAHGVAGYECVCQKQPLVRAGPRPLPPEPPPISDAERQRNATRLRDLVAGIGLAVPG